MSRLRLGVLVGLLALSACGSEESEAVGAVSGTQLIFELEGAGFYDAPYPSDLRLDEAGHPELSAFPNPNGVASFEGLIRIAGERDRFPTLPVAYFRFDGPLAARGLDQLIPAEVGAPVVLLELETGRLYPTVARTLDADGLYVPDNVLAVAAYPGIVLRANQSYAFVVMRSVLDAAGAPLGVPEALELLKAGRAPAGALGERALQLYAPLWGRLDGLGIPKREVAAATVFTTGDVVSETEELSNAIVAREEVVVENLAIDPDDGAAHARFCELHATVRFPQFQTGTPPFDTEGSFVIGSDGLPSVQREEVVPIVITLPKLAMPPEGYPLVIYFHGSGGLSSEVVDRASNAEPAKGFGPAHVLAAYGIATVGSAHPLNPERLPGAAETEYLNFDNLSAFRDTFRQGVLEQRLLIEALSTLKIDATSLAACGMSGAVPSYYFNPEPLLAMGQSMGGMYANLISAVEPRIGAVVPTGAGGFWSLFIVETKLIGNLGALAAIMLGLPATTELSHVHPALHVLETAWEPAEPMVYMPRLAQRPFESHPVRGIYEPIGKDDSYFPTTLYDAIAVAYGHEQAGEVVWPSLQEALAVVGREGVVPYPAALNVESVDHRPYTGVVVQYAGDGSFDPHEVFSQLDAVKYQYACFFDSFVRTGTGMVFEPGALGTPCP